MHFNGEDRKIGDLVVPVNTVISPSEIGVGASIGKSLVKVARMPKVIVISTGDELVEIDQKQNSIRSEDQMYIEYLLH